jgi:L-lactate dehydrogenase
LSCARRIKETAYEVIRRKGNTNAGVASVLVSILQLIVTDSDAIVTVSQVDTSLPEGQHYSIALSLQFD